MAGIESIGETSPQNGNGGPPALSIIIPKLGDVKVATKVWEEVKLPVDFMLVVVKDFLSCYVTII